MVDAAAKRALHQNGAILSLIETIRPKVGIGDVSKPFVAT